ncbi:MAG: hypothetical protein AAF707_01590 [Pseudomonadota bacterium]
MTVQEFADKRRADIRLVSLFIAFLMTAMLCMLTWLITLIAGDWCTGALAIEQAANEALSNNVTAECISLIDDQLLGLKIISYALVATLGLVVLVFSVVVWSGAKLSLEVDRDGVKSQVAREIVQEVTRKVKEI